MKRKLLTIFLVFAMTLGNSGLIKTGSAASHEAISVAVVFSTGGLGDLSFNDMANEGLQNALATHGTSLTSVSFEPEDVPEINAQIETYAASGDHALIIAVGFSSTDGVNASALAHTDQQFAIIDSVVGLPNVADVVFQEHEGSFLAGAIAGMVTQSNKLGFLGGLDIPLINKFRAGYEQGALYINPAITFEATYSPDPANPWGDLAGGKNVAEGMIENGADIIFAAAGGTGIGVMDAAEEALKNDQLAFAIGVDSNQDHLREGVVLTSMIKRVDTAVELLIADAVSTAHAMAGTITSLGLEVDGVGISDMEFTRSIGDAACSSSASILQTAAAIKASIIAGDIIVDDTLDYTPNTVAHPCSETLDTDVLDDYYQSESPLPVVPIFFGFALMALIVRRRKSSK
ncbi:MAG: BMP family ABC transporter substrate-binding protein [Candidatus Heimdallarchaeota archaeon]|nr:BMP family ABC transporter substrate-binding protein [Candidatus Heimdallarchaeota archaeon]